jgi:hypothetical protein
MGENNGDNSLMAKHKIVVLGMRVRFPLFALFFKK